MSKILLVDDDPQIRGLIKKSLEKDGYNVTTASDGLEALGIIYANKFDLILLDVVLPRIDGLGLLDVIKKREPDTMVVLISGQADVDSAIRAIKLGAYDFLKKPFGLKELENIVLDALNEAKSMKKAGYIYKNIAAKSLLSRKSGVLSGILDSVVLSLTYLVLVLLFQPPALSSKVSNPNDTFQLLRLSAGLGFCYLLTYVFKKCYYTTRIYSIKELSLFIIKNISYSYLTFMAIMFLVRDPFLQINKMLLGFSYFLAAVILIVERSILIPIIISKFGREGKKSLTITPASVPHSSGKMPINRLNGMNDSPNNIIASNARAADVAVNKGSAEIILDGRSISANEIMHLADNFKGKKLNVVIVGEPDKTFGRSES